MAKILSLTDISCQAMNGAHMVFKENEESRERNHEIITESK